MEYTIRACEPSDIFYIKTLSYDEYHVNNMFTAQAITTADDNTEKCFVAVVDNNIIGYIHGYVIPKKLMLPYFLYVKEEYRGNGIGVALLKHFENNVDAPVSLIYFEKRLHDYYKKQGYLIGNTEVALKEIPQNEDTI